MISKTSEYAVRAALWLAGTCESARTVQSIAAATAIPAGYLAKVLQVLGRAGIVRAQPGPGGGFLLARPPEDLTILEVIEAADPLPRIRSCPAGLPEHQAQLCPMHARLDRALESVEQALKGCTLASLLSESQSFVLNEGSKP